MSRRNVVVTGARRGLGLAIAERLARDGYHVLAVARASSPELDALCAAGGATYEELDLARLDALHGWVTAATRRHGRLYGLVNNAAVGADGLLATMHERDVSTVLRVNLESPILLAKYAARSMLLAGQGRIVNITSIVAATGFRGLSVYAAAKAGLQGFTRSLARELGSARITVNCVAPGFLETEMTRGLEGDKLAAIKRRSPSGELASVAAVAGAVAYLLGDDAAAITGTTVTVDAGSTA